MRRIVLAFMMGLATMLLMATSVFAEIGGTDCELEIRQYPQERVLTPWVVDVIQETTLRCPGRVPQVDWKTLDTVVQVAAPPVISPQGFYIPPPVFALAPIPGPVVLAPQLSSGWVGRFGARLTINGVTKMLPVQPSEYCVGYGESGTQGTLGIGVSGDNAWRGYIDAVAVNYNGQNLFSEPSLLEVNFPFTGGLTFTNGAYCFVPIEWGAWARNHRYTVLQGFTRKASPILSIGPN
mgnify:FL=1